MTITAKKLRDFLNMVPDNTPIYVISNDNEDGIIDTVSIDSVEDDNYKTFSIRLDYHV